MTKGDDMTILSASEFGDSTGKCNGIRFGINEKDDMLFCKFMARESKER
jgi:hypothetical protein